MLHAVLISFNSAADEAAVSRLYGGIHYRLANEIGLSMGRKIGEFVNDRLNTRMRLDQSTN